jgi:RNA polymerase sigma-70 factor (ECF subfamily)
LGTVLQVVYLIFNEGYSAEIAGAELSREAIRLGRLLLDLLQLQLIQEPEVMGLLGLMLLQESRRAARTSPDGDLILPGAAGSLVVESGADRRRHLAHRKRSSIAPLRCLHFAGGHCGCSPESSSVAATDWCEITLLYDRLLQIQPSPVVELNRAVAIAMCEGPEQGLRLIDDLLAREHLSHYHLAHSAARGDLCRRFGRIPEARASYEKALALATQEPDRRFLARRLEELKKNSSLLLSIFSVRDDYRMNDPTRKAVLLSEDR